MKKRIVVVGGANIDIMATANKKFRAHDSNPGTVAISHGGVGRNIAETLARLGHDVTFITALPASKEAAALKALLEGLGVQVCAVKTTRMPTYVALFNAHGELAGGIADMDSLDMLDAAEIRRLKHMFVDATVVVDANVSTVALAEVFTHVDMVFADAVSAQKALKLKPYLPYIHTLKLNREEFSVFLGSSTKRYDNDTLTNFVKTHQMRQCLLTEGKHGVRLINRTRVIHKLLNRPDIVNVSGAGDALFSGVIHATLLKLDPLLYGLALASLTMQSSSAVSQTITAQRLHERVEELL